MKTNTNMIIVVLLVFGMLILSGCTQNNGGSGYNAGDNGTTVNNGTSGTGDNMHAQSADQVAADLSGGTGSSSDDISNDDLDGMQSDLDSMQTEVDDSQQSDIN